ncbi:MAG TPA: 30S ribosomal protein S13, partial [Candidatus Bathyarchaeota archaeon]|nr:30S ribosomal protein S13 [Candidatus Bathyarchaeota archaeon]
MPKEFRHIVRIRETDVDGALKVPYALSKIKGIGINLAHLIVKKAGINPETRIGFISDEKIEKIEEIIANPDKYNIPEWYLNRRKDLETG